MDVRRAVLIVVGLAALGGCRMEAPERGEARERAEETGFRGRVIEDPAPRPDFELADVRGGTFDFREETEGHLTLLFFGYTHCPDICPVHMANLAAVLSDLPYPDRRRVRVVFVSTDPERDTPDRVRAWLDRFDPAFTGLVGDLERVNEVQAALGLPPAVRQDVAAGGEPGAGGDGGTGAEAGPYLVGHASQVLAVTGDGTARVVYPAGLRQIDWRHDLPRLLELDARLTGRPPAPGG